MSYEKVFTDVAKDVIGNEPVLDQFDIYYAASFFGTMQDDYITGSLLTARKTSSGTVYTAGDRSRAFSKYYASSQPPLASTFGSSAVANNPSLAFRQVPWSTRVSRTSYRLSQCFDSTERYYDSCLPNLRKCFAANGSELWASYPGTGSPISPYGNVVSSSIGFMFFNSYKTDRTSLGYTDDPVVNNEWTWSYPYDNMYDPSNRVLKTDSALGLDSVYLQGFYFPFITDVEDFLDILALSRSSTPLRLTGFFPILPGRLSRANMPAEARNSFRSRFVPPEDQFDIFGQVNRIPASYAASDLDDEYGISFLFPSDVDLSNKESHSWLSSFPAVTNPGQEYVTGTMNLDDTVKFLFGFGDLNNMTYGFRTFNSGAASTEYTQDFERANPADNRKFLSYDVPTYSSNYLTVDWSNSPQTSPWQYVIRDGTYSAVAATPPIFNYISGSSLPSVGLFWRDDAGTKEWVLLSDTSTNYGGGMSNIFSASICCMDITSSVPWSLKYKRGIAAKASAFLLTYFSGIPGYPSHELPLGPQQVVIPLDYMTGSGPSTRNDFLSEYNSQTDGIFDSDTGKNNTGADLYPFPPGQWRLNFSFARFDLTATPGSPDITAIKDVEISTFGPGCFPPDPTGQKIGGNNYPEFRTARVDPRYNPILDSLGTTKFQVTGSANAYKGYVFGISPVIRGWKYGLFNGLPAHSKTIFRRDRFGQFRDMLEQRHYTKFINVDEVNSPLNNDATSDGSLSAYERIIRMNSSKAGGNIGPSVVEVNFVRQEYVRDDRGIGYIYSRKVDPSETLSQNLSTEVTSSVPYTDLVARMRSEEEVAKASNTVLISATVGTSGIIVQ